MGGDFYGWGVIKNDHLLSLYIPNNTHLVKLINYRLKMSEKE